MNWHLQGWLRAAGHLPRLFRALWHAVLYRWSGRPVIAPYFIYRSREVRCKRCPHYDGLFCSKCSCLANLKVRLASEQCPDDPPRWSKL